MIVSSREAICLYWAAEGKSLREIALIEGDTLEETAVQFANIMVVLKAKTMADAVEKARLIELI